MLRRVISTATALAALGSLSLVAAPAQAAASGEKSLAAVLTSDGNKFDHNWNDFDIVTEAVLAVVAAKPDSAVKVLADGKVPLTAFVPTDRAFRLLAKDLLGKRPRTEKATFNALVKAVGVDTIETVLLYHVVPGATVNSKMALKSNGATLTTAAKLPIVVKVRGKRIILVDNDPNARNARVLVRKANINAGNKQIAHGIDRVLRPVDL